MLRFVALLFVILGSGCSDAPAGPHDKGVLDGIWSYRSDHWSGGDLDNCRIVNGVLFFSHRGNNIYGTLDSTMECLIDGQWASGRHGPWSIESGHVDGSLVAFSAPAYGFMHNGILEGDSIVGTFEFTDVRILYSGVFVATRR